MLANGAKDQIADPVRLALERFQLLACLSVPDFDFGIDACFLGVVPLAVGCRQTFAIGAEGYGAGPVRLTWERQSLLTGLQVPNLYTLILQRDGQEFVV